MNPSTFVGTSRYSQLIRSESWWNDDNDEHTSWAKQSCDHYRWYQIVGFRAIQITYRGKISNMPCEIQVAEMTGSPVAQRVHPWPLRNLRFTSDRQIYGQMICEKIPRPNTHIWMCLGQHTESYTANPLRGIVKMSIYTGHAEPCWNIMSIRMDWPGLCPWHQQASKQLAEVYLRSEGHGITIHGAPYLYWWMYGMFTFSSNYMKRTGI